MKKTTVALLLLLLTALLTACSIRVLDQPLYTRDPVETTTQATKLTDKIEPGPVDSSTTTTTADAPSSDGTTAPTPTTPPPLEGNSIAVTAEPEVIKEGETYTGNAPLPVISMTVNDPDNEAGLDDTVNEYAFGIAKNGEPNPISLDHQEYFDTHDRAALTIDTISTEKVLYLTFDNGYEYEGLTGDILDTLKEKNVPATFFCTLDYLEDNPDFVVRMIDEGHTVGNHSTTHPIMPELSREEMAQEILGVENYLRVNYGYSSHYFRFPTGAYSDVALELVGSVGYRSIFWSIAHTDWDPADQPSVEKTFDTVTSRLHPGSVILLHAISQSNASALADIIDYARAEGYVFRSLDEYPGW